MYFSRLSERHKYVARSNIKSGNVILKVTKCEKDLDVMVSTYLKWIAQVKSAYAKSNKILEMLKRTFVSRQNCIKITH